MQSQIDKLTRANSYDVLICDFLAPAVNVPRSLSCPAFLFQHNVEAMIWRRHYEVQTNPIKRGLFVRTVAQDARLRGRCLPAF